MTERKYKVNPLGWVKTTKGGTAHIPSLIRKEMGTDKIPYILDANTALLFDPEKDIKELLRSIEVLKEDLILRWDGPRGRETGRHYSLKLKAKEILRELGFSDEQIIFEHFFRVKDFWGKVDVAGISEQRSIAIECGTSNRFEWKYRYMPYDKIIILPYPEVPDGQLPSPEEYPMIEIRRIDL